MSLATTPLQAGCAPTAQDTPAPVTPRSLAERGLVDDAIAAWRARIAKDPTAREPRLELVDYLLERERFDDAVDAARDAIKALPNDYDVLLAMALACQRKGEALATSEKNKGQSQDWFRDAVRWSGEAIDVAPKKREAYVTRGMGNFILGRVDDAKADAETLLRVAPEHPSGRLLMIDCLFEDYQALQRAAKKAEATALAAKIEEHIQAAIALDPKRYLAWRRRGDLAAWDGRMDAATSAWIEALALDPDRGCPYDWVQANVSAEQRKALFSRALTRFDALGGKSGHAKARLHWEAGRLDFDAKDYDAARKHFQACYDLRSEWLNALFYHGLASWELDDKDMALLAFGLFAQKDAKQLAAAIVDSGPNRDVNKSYVIYFADLAFQRGNAAMSRDLNHTIALLEDDATRWNNYAFLCRETGLYEESHSAYSKALGHAPDDPQLLNDAAVILQYHLDRDLDEASAMYERAIANAKKQLANKGGSPEDKKRFEVAMTNAKMNLEALRKSGKASSGKARQPGK